jgi:hypothetical protein
LGEAFDQPAAEPGIRPSRIEPGPLQLEPLGIEDVTIE